MNKSTSQIMAMRSVIKGFIAEMAQNLSYIDNVRSTADPEMKIAFNEAWATLENITTMFFGDVTPVDILEETEEAKPAPYRDEPIKVTGPQ